MSPQTMDDSVRQRTSAAGSMVQIDPLTVLIRADAGLYPDIFVAGRDFTIYEPTNSGHVAPREQSSASTVMELYRTSGLTWDQLAKLFGVARRSLHLWASGKPLNSAHEETLQRFVSTLRKIDCGNPSLNRTALLRTLKNGSIPFDLLAAGQYHEVEVELAVAIRPIRPKPAPLSIAASAARAPQKPEELVDALQEQIHRDIGKARAVRVSRIAKRGKKK